MNDDKAFEAITQGEDIDVTQATIDVALAEIDRLRQRVIVYEGAAKKAREAMREGRKTHDPAVFQERYKTVHMLLRMIHPETTIKEIP